MFTNNTMSDIENCPICYCCFDTNNKDISTTACNHKFHTSCLIMSGNNCPLCRQHLLYNNGYTNSSNNNIIPPGIYSFDEFMEQMTSNNISMESLSIDTRYWIEECKEYKEDEKLMLDQIEKRKVKEKEYLKKHNPDKYKLLFK